MADEHAGGGGNKYGFLFLLAGAMLAAVAYQAIHTGVPLTTLLKNRVSGTATTASAPIVSTTTPVVSATRKNHAAPPRERWTTITLDQDGRVISVIHY